MPLGEPPSPARLRRLPSRRLAGCTLHRVYVRSGRSPWWFASVGDDPEGAGRFDVPARDGACYLGTSPVAAVLEAFQDFGDGLLPDLELRKRARAEVVVPRDAPPAAWLSAAHARGFGVTAALWAGAARAITQRWALALRRAGWLALFAGTQHDPSGRLRAVTLFDEAGEHPPFGDADGWPHVDKDLHDDGPLHQLLRAYGIQIARSDPDLPIVRLEDSRRRPGRHRRD